MRGKLAAIDGRRNKPSVSLLTLHLSNQRCGLQPPASDQKAINCLHASQLIFSAAAAARLISGGRLTRVARVCSSHSNRTRHLIAPPPKKKKKIRLYANHVHRPCHSSREFSSVGGARGGQIHFPQAPATLATSQAHPKDSRLVDR